MRYTSKRFSAELTGFTTKLNDVYFDQALILPPGAVGKFLGSEPIVSQNSRGWVSVAVAPTSPVLVRVNYDAARINGLEFNTQGRLSDQFTAKANFTYIRAYSLLNGLPPNIEGGVPNPAAFLSLRYQPRSRFYLEAYSTLTAVRDVSPRSTCLTVAPAPHVRAPPFKTSSVEALACAD